MTAPPVGPSPAESTRIGSTRIEVLADAETLARRAAEEVEVVLRAALERRDRATWVLAGGSTPRRTYELLAHRPRALDWGRVELYWGDERCVEPTSPTSNYSLVHDTLLAGLPIREDRVHRIRGELAPAEAARRYALELEATLDTGPFDLVLLGLGSDGHVASLFPGALPTAKELAAAVEAPAEPKLRVTMSPRALARSRRLVYLVAGPDKAPAVARAVDPEREGRQVSEMVRPANGDTLWLLDHDASVALASGSGRDRQRDR